MQSSQTGPRLKDLKLLKLFDSPQRNAITWVDEFIFDYISDEPTTAPIDDADVASARSSSFDNGVNDSDSSIVYENSSEDDSSCGKEAVNVEPFVDVVLPLHARDAEQTEVVIMTVVVVRCSFRTTSV